MFLTVWGLCHFIQRYCSQFSWFLIYSFIELPYRHLFTRKTKVNILKIHTKLFLYLLGFSRAYREMLANFRLQQKPSSQVSIKWKFWQGSRICKSSDRLLWKEETRIMVFMFIAPHLKKLCTVTAKIIAYAN